MCLELFVASDERLLLIPFDPAAPAFSTSTLWPEDQPVRRRFSKPFVYSVGAQTGCSCGFSYNSHDLSPDLLSDPDVPEAVKASVIEDCAARRESVRQLKEFLGAAMQSSGSAEVFSCWAGDEASEPVSRRAVSLAHFSGESFRFIEKELLTVLRDGAPAAR